jgi:quercetin dioxygenase-like cupin family protein
MTEIRFTTVLLAAATALLVGLTVPRNGVAEPAPIQFRTVLQSDLEGLPNRETIVQVLDIAPGAPVPWHMHPDGHEIAYVMEGTAILEVEGKPAQTIEAGGGFLVQPNLPHGGRNGSTTAPLRLVVVRLKPKDKPAVVPVKK